MHHVVNAKSSVRYVPSTVDQWLEEVAADHVDHYYRSWKCLKSLPPGVKRKNVQSQTLPFRCAPGSSAISPLAVQGQRNRLCTIPNASTNCHGRVWGGLGTLSYIALDIHATSGEFKVVACPEHCAARLLPGCVMACAPDETWRTPSARTVPHDLHALVQCRDLA